MAVTFEYASYASGINASALPLRNIRPDELPLMVNATVRNGFAQTRPGYESVPLSFFDADQRQYTFEQGKFQGCGRFLSNDGNLAIFVVDGEVFSYNPLTGYVKNYDLVSGKAPFSKFSKHAWVQQRAEWLIVQDGQSPPFRTNGAVNEQTLTVLNTTSATPADLGKLEASVPTGTIMAEGWHRLFVVDPTRRRVYVSDHDMDPNSTPISFTEQTDYYLNARYFEGPPALGLIMGLAFTPYQDTSTGIGPLLVFFEKGMQAYNVAVPRSQWLTQDITQTILPSVGSSTFYAYSDKGADLVFRDQEGRIRTVRNAQQFQASGANFTNDFAIWNLIKGEDALLREYSQAVTYDRRTLVLTHPERAYLPDNRYNVVHKAVAVMENEHLSDKQDVWSFWTGLNICGFVTLPVGGEEQLIAFCRDPDGVNRLYKLTKDGKYDRLDTGLPSGGQKRIQMTLTTAPLDFGASARPKTNFMSALRMTGLQGEVKVCGRWQSDNNSPIPWFQHKELHPSCLNFSSNPCGIRQMAPGVQPRLVLPSDPTGRGFNEVALTFDVFGPAIFSELIMMADIQSVPTVTNVTCAPTMSQPAQVLCEVNPLCYSAFEAEVAPQPNLPVCPL